MEVAFDCNAPSVGASLLAKVANDDAGNLDERGVLEFFASKLAPTGGGGDLRACWEYRTCAGDGRWRCGRFAGGWPVAVWTDS
ncbi:hypothetical protein CEC48_29855 [Pseudomonas sp. K2I15]|nr:hypothetical protein CEC48_29855 [Pseudomonas sp. K2I15]